jgi:bacteriorhodopsin
MLSLTYLTKEARSRLNMGPSHLSSAGTAAALVSLWVLLRVLLRVCFLAGDGGIKVKVDIEAVNYVRIQIYSLAGLIE